MPNVTLRFLRWLGVFALLAGITGAEARANFTRLLTTGQRPGSIPLTLTTTDTATSRDTAVNGSLTFESYGVSGTMAPSETRTYSYDKRGRAKTEPFLLTNTGSGQLTGSQTASYLFDQPAVDEAGIEGGLGVRTLQSVTDTVGYEVLGQNNFQQATQDLNATQSGIQQTLNFEYDAAGYVSSRTDPNGVAQTMTWDVWGRLVLVSARDGTNSGADFATIYDGLGRRVQSTWQNVTAGAADGDPTALTYYYDPQVEFLELGVNDAGVRTWRVYGPDLNGIYGALQGTGGLEALVDETSGIVTGSINDRFGNSLGLGAGGSYYSHGSALGGYGVMPGSSLDYSLSLDNQWRGRYIDWTGFYCMGARYYDPQSGRFLSPDPLGHAASMSLYDYCGNDPVNRWDYLGMDDVTGVVDNHQKLMAALKALGADTTQEQKDFRRQQLGATVFADGAEAAAGLQPVVGATEAITGESAAGTRKLKWWERLLGIAPVATKGAGLTVKGVNALRAAINTAAEVKELESVAMGMSRIRIGMEIPEEVATYSNRYFDAVAGLSQDYSDLARWAREMVKNSKSAPAFRIIPNAREGSQMLNGAVYLREGARRVDFIEEFSHWRMSYGDQFLAAEKRLIRAKLKKAGLRQVGEGAEEIAIKTYMVENYESLGLEAVDVEFLKNQIDYIWKMGGGMH